MANETVDKETLRLLMDGQLPDEEVKRLQRLTPKDHDRFWTYLEILQERVAWDDRILMRISDHLYIVRDKRGDRIVKCDCGHEFGDYRVNWKLNSMVRVRTTKEEFAEVYQPAEAAPDPDLVEIREFFCPGCYTQLAVESALPGDPFLFEFLPDLDSFYRDWMGRPLEDEVEFRDLTTDVTNAWAKEDEAA